MDFQVNGSTFHTANGMFALKPLFGLHSVLAKTDSSPASSPNTPLGRVVVAPVDARGRFLVEHKGVYCVTTFQSQEDYKALLTRKLQREQYAKRSHENKGKATHRPERARRGSTAYTQFVGEFMKNFHNTSFTDASAAWRSIDSTARKLCSTKELIAKIARKGRYELTVPKRPQ